MRNILSTSVLIYKGIDLLIYITFDISIYVKVSVISLIAVIYANPR